MRKLALLTLFLAARLSAQSPLCPQIQALTQASQAHWGVSITTLDGTPLCQINAAQLFRPASNAKLFTTITALALFGPQQTFPTSVMADKPPAATLQGNLTLLGDGDAYLSTRPVPYVPSNKIPPDTPAPTNPLEALADQVVATGIHHITGDIIGEDTVWPSEPYPSDWSIDDMQWGYGAPVSALSVDDNKLTLTITPGATTVDLPLAVLSPPTTHFRFDIEASTVAAGKPTALRLEQRPGSDLIHIYGTIALGASYSDDIAIDDPAQYAAERFKSLLEARGVIIDGQPRAEHRPSYTTESFEKQTDTPLQFQPTPRQPSLIATNKPGMPPIIAMHLSPSLIDDVTITLKVSQNLHAELLLHLLGQQFAGEGSTAQGARVVRQFLMSAASLQKTDFLLYDGSGLSGHDLITPRSLTQLLVFAARQPWFPSFKAALPLGGVDGSLTSRFTGPLKGRVFAKTGTLGESRALSGFLTASSGRTLVFSILVDNHPPNSTADRTLMDHIVELTAAAN